jgi:hypothetical protein
MNPNGVAQGQARTWENRFRLIKFFTVIGSTCKAARHLVTTLWQTPQ